MPELRFLYVPVADLDAAAEYYTTVLGFVEAWRDRDLSIGMRLPGGGSQVMLSTSGKPAGPMYLVESLDQWIAEHPDLDVMIQRDSAGSGHVAGFRDPGGNVFYVYDQPVSRPRHR